MRNVESKPPVGRPGITVEAFTAPKAFPGAVAGAEVVPITATRADAIEVIISREAAESANGILTNVAAPAITVDGATAAYVPSALAASTTVDGEMTIPSLTAVAIALVRITAMTVRVARTVAASAGVTLVADKRSES